MNINHWRARLMVSHPACGQPDSFMEGSPNGMAAVLKTAVPRDVGVQVPHPPQV